MSNVLMDWLKKFTQQVIVGCGRPVCTHPYCASNPCSFFSFLFLFNKYLYLITLKYVKSMSKTALLLSESK